MTACEALNLVRKRSVKTLIPTGLDRVAFQKSTGKGKKEWSLLSRTSVFGISAVGRQANLHKPE